MDNDWLDCDFEAAVDVLVGGGVADANVLFADGSIAVVLVTATASAAAITATAIASVAAVAVVVAVASIVGTVLTTLRLPFLRAIAITNWMTAMDDIP
jgi:prepilin-type processing-associated H-X9-DG protein